MISSICILGGTGFVGSDLAARLVSRKHRIKILSRQRERHRHLLLLPTVQVSDGQSFQVDALARAFTGQDVVINLIGILNERGHSGEGFQTAHVELARNVVTACRKAGVKRLLHMSALSADAASGTSVYLRSKGEAEGIVLTHCAGELNVTVFQPSVIFGIGDDFLNRFAKILRLTPLWFPLACPNTRFAPVYVGDVSEAFMRAMDNPETFGKRYELCGPEIYTLREIVNYVAELTGHRCHIVGLPNALAYLQAALLEWFPGKPFSLDNYRSLQTDSVCHKNGFAAFGITPISIDTVAPRYLAGYHARNRYAFYRREAGRY